MDQCPRLVQSLDAGRVAWTSGRLPSVLVMPHTWLFSHWDDDRYQRTCYSIVDSVRTGYLELFGVFYIIIISAK